MSNEGYHESVNEFSARLRHVLLGERPIAPH